MAMLLDRSESTAQKKNQKSPASMSKASGVARRIDDTERNGGIPE
jgi:hypothetical protein